MSFTIASKNNKNLLFRTIRGARIFVVGVLIFIMQITYLFNFCGIPEHLATKRSPPPSRMHKEVYGILANEPSLLL